MQRLQAVIIPQILREPSIKLLCFNSLKSAHRCYGILPFTNFKECLLVGGQDDDPDFFRDEADERMKKARGIEARQTDWDPILIVRCN